MTRAQAEAMVADLNVQVEEKVKPFVDQAAALRRELDASNEELRQAQAELCGLYAVTGDVYKACEVAERAKVEASASAKRAEAAEEEASAADKRAGAADEARGVAVERAAAAETARAVAAEAAAAALADAAREARELRAALSKAQAQAADAEAAKSHAEKAATDAAARAEEDKAALARQVGELRAQLEKEREARDCSWPVEDWHCRDGQRRKMTNLNDDTNDCRRQLVRVQQCSENALGRLACAF